MSQFGAIYLSFNDEPIENVDLISDMLKEKGYLFTIRYHHEKSWVQLYVEEPENTPYHAKDVSAIFPDRKVIGLAAYTVSDSVIFCEYSHGETIRLLQSGFERELEWEKIEGESQPWEADIFGENKPEIGSMGSFDIYKIGQLFDMPGFGTPKHGESWTKEIFN